MWQKDYMESFTKMINHCVWLILNKCGDIPFYIKVYFSFLSNIWKLHPKQNSAVKSSWIIWWWFTFLFQDCKKLLLRKNCSKHDSLWVSLWRGLFPASNGDLATPDWLESYCQCHLAWSVIEEFLLKCLDKLKLATYMFLNIINDEPAGSSGPKLLMIP